MRTVPNHIPPREGFPARAAKAALVAAALMLLILLLAPPCRAAVRNMTEENRTALSAKILELRQTELMRVSRGRVKPNPILLPQFTAYQTALLDQDFMLTRQLDDYKAALGEIQLAKKDFLIFAASPLGTEISRIFDQRIISSYSLKGKLDKAETMWEVWYAVAGSGNELQALPVEYRMAMNAGVWLEKIAGDALPQPALDELLELCKTEIHPMSVFDTDAMLIGISKRYSDFFLEITTQGGAK
jgi:hypothetical protein